MGTATGRTVLFGDVALIGVGVFVAVAMVLAALGGPASATSGATGSTFAAAQGDPAGDATPAGGDADTAGTSTSDDPAPAATPSAEGAAGAAGHGGHGGDHGSAGHGGDHGSAPGASSAAPRSTALPASTPTTASSGGEHGHGHGSDADTGHGHGDEGHASGASADHGHGDEGQAGTAGTDHGHGDEGHASGGSDHADGGGHAHDDADGSGHGGDDHGHGEPEGGDASPTDALTGLVPVPGLADEDEDDGHDDDHGDGSHPTGSHGDHAAGCDEDHPAAQQLLADVQNSLDTTYKNVASMIAQGFIPYFDAQIPLGLATEGTGHWLNPDYIDNGVQLDAYRPEGILTDQFHNPIGIMFIADADGYEKPVYVNDDGTECSPWHPHTDTPATFSWFFYELAFDGKWMEGDVEWQPVTPAMLHVWAVDNPHGVFAAHDYPEVEDRPGLSLERQVPLPAPAPFGDVLPTIDEQLGPLNEATCPHC